MRGATSSLVQLQITLGILMPTLLGLGLPASQALVRETDVFWRIVIAFPILVALLQILLFVFLFRYNTPQTYLEYGHRDRAIQALNQVYTKSGAELRCQQLELETHLIATSTITSTNEVNANPKKALMVAIVLNIFKQLTGLPAILFYSTQLFDNNSDPSYIKMGNEIAALINGVNFLTAIIALPLIDKLGRKLMLVIGFFVMSISIILVGLMQEFHHNEVARFIILVFIIAFQFSAGPIVWVYTPEIVNRAGITIATAATWLFIIAVSLGTPYLNKYTGPWVFYIYGICSGVAFIFILVFVIESKGRTLYEMQ